VPDVRVLLLCGGRASRFGSDKLLVPVKRGGETLPMAALSARGAIEGAGNALAVIPPGAEELREVLAGAGCDVLESEATARGLGASLAAGVARSRAAEGWIVALGDMPFIEASTFASVLLALRAGALIAAPVHRTTNARGHPVGFSRRLRDELAALDGDEGARAIVQAHREFVALIPVDDEGITIDIDTPRDLP
jgi:molybdenum cofactor cytidylyltransferase